MLSRLPAPPILFTAIAATVVILPWAVSGVPGAEPEPSTPDAADTALIEQPLADVPGGRTVREISQPTPFSLVALTGDDLTGTSTEVRALQPSGTWGPWYEAHTVESSSSDQTADAPPQGTEPVFVGSTTVVQIAITRPEGAPVTVASATVGESDDDLGYRPATIEEPIGTNLNAVLIAPPEAPADPNWLPPTGVLTPGMPPTVITRAQWGADESMRCGEPRYENGIRAAVVHHTAGSNDYRPEDSAAIVRAIYTYHTRTLGWCDIAYNALVDRYGQVFEGRAGGINMPVFGSHTGGFNANTWGIALMGNFDAEPPTPVQLRTVGRMLGWRLGLDHVDPLGTVQLTSAGGFFTTFSGGATPTLPTIFTHRDVGNTDCPGDAGYAALGQIRDIAARFDDPPGPEDLAISMEGGAIYARWQAEGGMTGALGAPTSPESAGDGSARYATFLNGAVYWSPETGAAPLTGAIYQTWASLGYERSALGLPTSGEIQEPLWIVQNFQHGTLNFDREHGTVTRVIDGVAEELPPLVSGPPVQLERFTPAVSP
ncbi:MAG: N-acetylmuramoyl-L-alanine amidase [Mycobacterium sp.]